MPNQEILFDEHQFIVSKTDVHGKISYGNDLFIAISGYSECELIHAPHSILRHKDMPKIIFKYLWSAIKSKNEIFAYVKNKTKSDDYYWVLAHVTASYDESGKIIGFHSVRRKPSDKALKIIIPLYRQLLLLEKSGGIALSEEYMNDLLMSKGVDYEQFILSL